MQSPSRFVASTREYGRPNSAALQTTTQTELLTGNDLELIHGGWQVSLTA